MLAISRRFLLSSGRWPQLVEADLERACNHFEKTSRARGALVVHGEVGYLAAGVHVDGLAVLATDVEDGANGGVEVVRAAPVAADLGHVLVGKRDAHAAVSVAMVHATWSGVDLRARAPRGTRARRKRRLSHVLMTDARDDFACLVHDDGVGGSRA